MVKIQNSLFPTELATFFQILDTWWSTLDIMNDFKLISRTVIFRFGEINNFQARHQLLESRICDPVLGTEY